MPMCAMTGYTYADSVSRICRFDNVCTPTRRYGGKEEGPRGAPPPYARGVPRLTVGYSARFRRASINALDYK